MTTRDHGNVQSRDQEESKLNSKIYANIGAHIIIHDKIIKTPFNKNNVETIETNKIITKIPLLGSIKQVKWCRCNVPIQRWLITNYQQVLFQFQ